MRYSQDKLKTDTVMEEGPVPAGLELISDITPSYSSCSPGPGSCQPSSYDQTGVYLVRHPGPPPPLSSGWVRVEPTRAKA